MIRRNGIVYRTDCWLEQETYGGGGLGLGWVSLLPGLHKIYNLGKSMDENYEIVERPIKFENESLQDLPNIVLRLRTPKTISYKITFILGN